MAEGGQKKSMFSSLGPGVLVAEAFSEFTSPLFCCPYLEIYGPHDLI